MSGSSRSPSPDDPTVGSGDDSEDGEDTGPPETGAFLQHVSKKYRACQRVSLDHMYSRHWGWRRDNEHALQTRLLLVNPTSKPSKEYCDEPVDVVTVDDNVDAVDSDDEIVSTAAMLECYDHIGPSRDVPEDLIDNIDQSQWTRPQSRLLSRVLTALRRYLLARRALHGSEGGAFAARLHADRAAARVRRALAEVGWQRRLCQWLHGLLMQKLSRELLALYLEVLQTLNSKVPSLVERLTSGGGVRQGALSAENLAHLLRRPWDPAAHILQQYKLKRLPSGPLLVLVPSVPGQTWTAGPAAVSSATGAAPREPETPALRRLEFWQQQLANMGKVVTFTPLDGGAAAVGASVAESLVHTLDVCRSQVCELKRARPGRPLVLLGWGVGALLACRLALVESVSALVCLGPPLESPAGRRGQPDDPLLELRSPTLLVVGQTAADASPQRAELLRERMRAADTGLLVVGGADSQLRINPEKRCRERLTQRMVDRAILEEVYEFLLDVIGQQLEGALPVFPPVPNLAVWREEPGSQLNKTAGGAEGKRKPAGKRRPAKPAGRTATKSGGRKSSGDRAGAVRCPGSVPALHRQTAVDATAESSVPAAAGATEATPVDTTPDSGPPSSSVSAADTDSTTATVVSTAVSTAPTTVSDPPSTEDTPAGLTDPVPVPPPPPPAEQQQEPPPPPPRTITLMPGRIGSLSQAGVQLSTAVGRPANAPLKVIMSPLKIRTTPSTGSQPGFSALPPRDLQQFTANPNKRRLKITQKIDPPTQPHKRVKGRGRPQIYGNNREFMMTAAQLGSARFLSSAGPRASELGGPTGASAADSPDSESAGPEVPGNTSGVDLTGQGTVYLTPAGAGVSGGGAERLLYVPGGRGRARAPGAPGGYVVAPGRPRTVTYIPARAVGRPQGHEYSVSTVRAQYQYHHQRKPQQPTPAVLSSQRQLQQPAPAVLSSQRQLQPPAPAVLSSQRQLQQPAPAVLSSQRQQQQPPAPAVLSSQRQQQQQPAAAVLSSQRQLQQQPAPAVLSSQRQLQQQQQPAVATGVGRALRTAVYTRLTPGRGRALPPDT